MDTNSIQVSLETALIKAALVNMFYINNRSHDYLNVKGVSCIVTNLQRTITQLCGAPHLYEEF